MMRTKFFFTATIILCCFAGKAQTKSAEIDINSKGLFLNATQITSETLPADMLPILGEPDRKTLKPFHMIWTYDNLGFKVYLDTSSAVVESIDVDFKYGDAEYSPKKPFTGKLTIHGVAVTKSTPPKSLKKIKGLEFDETASGSYYSAKSPSLNLTFVYYKDKITIDAVGIEIDR